MAETAELAGDIAVKKPHGYSSWILNTRKWRGVISVARLTQIPAYVAPLPCTDGLGRLFSSSRTSNCLAWSFWGSCVLPWTFLVPAILFWASHSKLSAQGCFTPVKALEMPLLSKAPSLAPRVTSHCHYNLCCVGWPLPPPPSSTEGCIDLSSWNKFPFWVGPMPWHWLNGSPQPEIKYVPCWK